MEYSPSTCLKIRSAGASKASLISGMPLAVVLLVLSISALSAPALGARVRVGFDGGVCTVEDAIGVLDSADFNDPVSRYFEIDPDTVDEEFDELYAGVYSDLDGSLALEVGGVQFWTSAIVVAITNDFGGLDLYQVQALHPEVDGVVISDASASVLFFKLVLEDWTQEALASDELVLPPPDPDPPAPSAHGVVRGCPPLQADCGPGEGYHLNFRIDRFFLVPEPSQTLQIFSALTTLGLLARRGHKA